MTQLYHLSREILALLDLGQDSDEEEDITNSRLMHRKMLTCLRTHHQGAQGTSADELSS